MKKLSFKKGTKNFNMVIEFNDEENCYVMNIHDTCCTDKTYYFPKSEILDTHEKLHYIGKLLNAYNMMFSYGHGSFETNKKFMTFVNKFVQEYYGFSNMDLINDTDKANALEENYICFTRVYNFTF